MCERKAEIADAALSTTRWKDRVVWLGDEEQGDSGGVAHVDTPLAIGFGTLAAVGRCTRMSTALAAIKQRGMYGRHEAMRSVPNIDACDRRQ